MEDEDQTLGFTCDPAKLPRAVREAAVDGESIPRWLRLAETITKERERAGERISPPLATMGPPALAGSQRPEAEYAAMLGGQVVVKLLRERFGVGPEHITVPSPADNPPAPRQTGGIRLTANPLRWLRRLLGRR